MRTHGRGWPGRIARSLPAVRGKGRLRRQLARIEQALESESRLASMFAMFNALNRGERPSGAEPLPRRSGWRRVWLTPAAALLAMAAVVIGGLLLGSGLRPVSQACMMLAAQGTPAAAPAAVPMIAPVESARAPSRPAASGASGALCPAYPAKK